MTPRSGRFDYSETDLRVESPGVPFEFTRYHNTQTHLPGPLGFQWGHSYHWPLRVLPSGDVEITGPLLIPMVFVKQSNGTFVPTTSAREFELTTAPDGLFHLKRDKLTYDFNQGGLLSTIRGPDNLGLSLSYEPITTDALWGVLLKKVTDSVGRTYTLSWTAVSEAQLALALLPPGNYHQLDKLTQDATGRTFTFDHGPPETSALTLYAVHDSAYPPAQFMSYGYWGSYRSQRSAGTLRNSSLCVCRAGSSR
ncbi:MAG: hypothetical protein HY816_04580 [Candidatus Wallbacteria bacterium]|nr:hypothetical protein [Candidatus Wallbacteria bacterium]